MKIFCGNDIIEINRVKKSIENLQNTFLKKVYTENEINYCNSKGAAKYQHFAARFAVKEATFKALSNLFKDKTYVEWKNIECLNNNFGKPYINLKGYDMKKIENIDVSISHCKDYAIATVIVLAKEDENENI